VFISFIFSDWTWSSLLLGTKSCRRSSCYTVQILKNFLFIIVIIFSWKRDENGSIVYRRWNERDHLKPVLEFVSIQRHDTKQWALPGVKDFCFLKYSS
jgi:hypothetical protein